MSRNLPLTSLPISLRVEDAVDASCSADIVFIEERLRRGQSVLVECDKELSFFLYMAVRDRLKRRGEKTKIVLIDGRPAPDDPQPLGGLGEMMKQLRNVVRGSIDRTIVVLLHLDILTTTHTGLTIEARESIPLLYENPEAVFLGFRDPSFEIPKVIHSVFGAHREITGIPREALPKIITQREAKSISGTEFDPFGLYKYVSGLNPVRCRRIFGDLALRREATPGRSAAQEVYQDIRRQTVSEDVELPNVDLDADIGGYLDVKTRMKEEMIDLIRRKEALTSETDIQALESLLPRGVIFYGPPGTGKTYFAKAIATAINATVHIVAGPELKSKWVGESEANLRQIFRKARQSAPSVIVFDEIDAFAHARGSYAGSGVEHSMVNQLLTEMDGFRKNEMIFVIGTTNFLESLDGALLRPGRFEFLIEIPAPTPEDRAEIARIYSKKMTLNLDDDLINHMVRRTDGLADRERGYPFTGDHLYSICRALKRQALRTGANIFTNDDIDKALQRKTRRQIVLSKEEEYVIAVHEAGHALIAMLLPKATPPERISITPDMEGALGYVLRAARAKPYAMTEDEMRAEICVGFGGHSAERLVIGEVSVGAYTDLKQASQIAHSMVEEYGMSGGLGPRVLLEDSRGRLGSDLSEYRRAQMDEQIDKILREELTRSEILLRDHITLHKALVDLLLEKKVIDAKTLTSSIQIPAKS
jgi:cell division protease FtsH